MKITLTGLLILVLGSAPAWAILGESESSVTLDQQVLRGADREEARTGYKIHQLTMADGGVVKEFVAPAGLVFGIAWQGSRMPNLQQLLGSHMAELETALQSNARQPGRRPLIVRTDKLVFVSGGHMRAFHGYAYVPSLVPGNVSPEAVQ
ncbi:MAG TPA: DUF2844 domain-containing protein [Bryobacteraceae bacterium]|nr:DUF2844 domain-containing protein [Bryobacteraceae bacterium]